MTPSPDDARAPRLRWVLLAGLLALKLALLAAYGPIAHPDTRGYEDFAAQILAGPQWLLDPGLEHDPIPTTAFRAVGYPLAVAFARLVAPSTHEWLLVLLQIGLSLAATAAFFDLCLLATRSRVLSLLAASAQATGLALALDQALLSDSAAASLLLLFLCRVGSSVLRHDEVSPAQSLRRGALLAGAFLLRETTLALSPVLLLPVAWAAWLRPRGRLPMAALHGAPLILVALACMAWGQVRFGSPIVTTGRQTILLQPLLEAERAGVPVFDGDEPLDRAARATHHRDTIGDVSKINGWLHREAGLVAPQIAAAARDRLMVVSRRHPGAMLRLAIGRYGPSHLAAPVQPLESVAELHGRARGERPWPPRAALLRRDGAEGSAVPLWLWFLQAAVSLLGAGATLALVALVPLRVTWRRLRGRPNTPLDRLLLVFASVYLGFVLAHAPIHLEPRYLAPVVPLALLAAIAGWRRPARRGDENEPA